MAGELPSGFMWGVATSAYQIEGAVRADGRGESIWDRFCRRPGSVRAAASGEIACDFYHRHPDDIGLMRELGVDAFRFSVAWPRVIPDGTGSVNEAGLDFYERLVDALLEAGIEPFVNLFHWDLPQPLEDAGGWPERTTAEAFVRYAETVATRLGDRVRHWIRTTSRTAPRGSATASGCTRPAAPASTTRSPRRTTHSSPTAGRSRRCGAPRLAPPSGR
jgi:beta-glucosidase